MKKLIYGVAYNSKGRYKANKNGRKTNSYSTWYSMIKRCYSDKYQDKFPTYIGCSVDEMWHDYQNFAEWFYNHPYSNMGYQLDKDILKTNNKVYSPESCVFVPSQLNSLLLDNKAARGLYPQGVSFDKKKGRYSARLNINGKLNRLGNFSCAREAYNAYKLAKESYVKVSAIEWKDRIELKVYESLMQWCLPNLT